MITLLPVSASSKHTPHRYKDHPRNIKHAGTIPVSQTKTSMMHLNYNTGAAFNYKTGGFGNYNNRSGFKYSDTATNLRYR